jgi:HEPN domain-containing protein
MGGVNRQDLQSLARTRLAEAKTLLRAGRSDGAYYLAGYAVECGLKACIAKATKRYDFPEKKSVESSYTHNLKDLVKAAKLDLTRLEEAKRDPIFRNYWDRVQEWSEQSRYGRFGSKTASSLLKAIGDQTHGVRAWINDTDNAGLRDRK